MIKLGVHDPEVAETAIGDYFLRMSEILNYNPGVRERVLRGEQNKQFVSFTPLRNGPIKVADVQQFLMERGFFPDAVIDGICGYRTQSAIRLFQEYARVFHPETLADYPDGQFGPKSVAAADLWIKNGIKADWSSITSAAPTSEFAKWLQLMARFKERSLDEPSPLLRKALQFNQSSSTIKPGKWNFDPERIHLLGIRYQVDKGLEGRTFDDLFVLLVNGLVFKFKGSTDPGYTKRSDGAPFLVPGQHQYVFGWHKLSSPDSAYHALKPVLPGVLVLRTRKSLSVEVLRSKSAVETNSSINIHWGGRGRGLVEKWSEGCQVVTGDKYLNHYGSCIDCSPFSAVRGSELGTRRNGVYQIKGAYSVLTDLVTALSGNSAEKRIVLYTLLHRHDLQLDPQLSGIFDESFASFN